MRCRRIVSERSVCLKRVVASKRKLNPPAATVTIPLVEILESLAAAAGDGHLWLRDFYDDSVTISGDLHEMLRAFAAMRREDAAISH